VSRRVLAVVGVALLSFASACGEDDGADGEIVPPSGEVTSSTVDPDDLPPASAEDLEELYGEALAAIGMRLTDRGGLIDRSGGGYVASPTGRHLALYVEPTGERTLAEFYDGILDVALVFSDIYERWPGLESYDVCQEPTDPDGTQGPEPLPMTQIELTRAESDAIDWESVTVDDLVRASIAEPPGLALRVSTEMATHPPYAAIVEPEARTTGG
jgi:hypothetical protein